MRTAFEYSDQYDLFLAILTPLFLVPFSFCVTSACVLWFTRLDPALSRRRRYSYRRGRATILYSPSMARL
jgi:hypothetical protein